MHNRLGIYVLNANLTGKCFESNFQLKDTFDFYCHMTMIFVRSVTRVTHMKCVTL
jgi:hypothetical protein